MATPHGSHSYPHPITTLPRGWIFYFVNGPDHISRVSTKRMSISSSSHSHPLAELPEELFSEITSYLSPLEKACLALTSHAMLWRSTNALSLYAVRSMIAVLLASDRCNFPYKSRHPSNLVSRLAWDRELDSPWSWRARYSRRCCDYYTENRGSCGVVLDLGDNIGVLGCYSQRFKFSTGELLNFDDKYADKPTGRKQHRETVRIVDGRLIAKSREVYFLRTYKGGGIIPAAIDLIRENGLGVRGPCSHSGWWLCLPDELPSLCSRCTSTKFVYTGPVINCYHCRCDVAITIIRIPQQGLICIFTMWKDFGPNADIMLLLPPYSRTRFNALPSNEPPARQRNGRLRRPILPLPHIPSPIYRYAPPGPRPVAQDRSGPDAFRDYEGIRGPETPCQYLPNVAYRLDEDGFLVFDELPF